jgi:hypothetical protein
MVRRSRRRSFRTVIVTVAIGIYFSADASLQQHVVSILVWFNPF